MAGSGLLNLVLAELLPTGLAAAFDPLLSLRKTVSVRETFAVAYAFLSGWGYWPASDARGLV